jgi:chromosome segregation ATPase
MSRPAVLPLPDASVRHILSHLDDIRATFPVSRGNRPFLAAFLRLVYEATGEVYGANISRKLLQTYAPEYRPSNVTIHDETLALRDSLSDKKMQAIAPSDEPAASDEKSSVHIPHAAPLSSLAAGLDRVLTRLNSTPNQEDGGFYQDALIRTLESENQRLREHSKHLQSIIDALQQSKSEHDEKILALTVERDTLASTVKDLTDQVATLAEALKSNNERVASSHRFAMGRIEDATGELRRYKELIEAEKQKTAAFQKKYEDEQAMNDALRQAFNKFRNDVADQRRKAQNAETSDLTQKGFE